VYLYLVLAVGKGKATFRDLKIEKISDETVYEWEFWSNSQSTNFTISPETGTFIIENSDYTDARFRRRVDIESAGIYQLSAEVKIEDFQANPDNPQDWPNLGIGNINDGQWYSRGEAGMNLPNDEWTNISGMFAATDDDSVYLYLVLAVGKGKATFRDLKLEKISNETVFVARNPMIPRPYDVLKDQQWAQYARSIDIKNYNLPDAIGIPTLTYDDAVALIGKDPAEIAAAVKTVGDVLQYMIASRFGYSGNMSWGPDYNSVSSLRIGSDVWNFDPPGNEQLIAGYYCCCGGMASTVIYLLSGSYDKVGILQWRGGGEGHVINWVQTGGKYYVFDFVALTGGTSYTTFDFPVIVLDRLEDYYDKFPDWFAENWDTDKSVFKIVIAYEADVLYAGKLDHSDEITIMMPTFAKDNIIIVYEQTPGNNFSFIDFPLFPSNYPDYWGRPTMPPKPALTAPINIPLETKPAEPVIIPLGEIIFAQDEDEKEDEEPELIPVPNLSTASGWAHDIITEAYTKNLIPEELQDGYTDNITRAEFCALAVALYENVTGEEIAGREKFTDTDDINVEKAAYIKVVNGMGDGAFAPDAGLTREQAATMLARLADAVGKPLAKQAADFADNGDISLWAADAVGQMQATRIMQGVGGNRFAPKDSYTREQSIITILRLYNFVS
jgi:hypothetical protein